MNRAPSPRDPWWSDHQRKCGGSFVKIKEPENYGNKKKSKEKNPDTKESNLNRNNETLTKNVKHISDYFSNNGSKKPSTDFKKTSSGSNKTNPGKKKPHANGNTKLGGGTRTSATITVKGNSRTSTDENQIYQSSSDNSSSNIYGFKMSANKNPRQSSHVTSFSGTGFAVGGPVTSVNTNTSTKDGAGNLREQFLRNLENKINTNRTAAIDRKPEIKKGDTTKGTGLVGRNNGIKQHNIAESSNVSSGSVPPNKKIKIENNVATSWESNSKSFINSIQSNELTKNSIIGQVNSATDPSKQSHSKAGICDVICIEDNDDDLIENSQIFEDHLVDCPACPAKVPEHELNRHLDICLA